jgi:dihydrofolate reductase
MENVAMSDLTATISMSLDGFITGPNEKVGNGLGDGGERLHDWMFATPQATTDKRFMDEVFRGPGAVIIGRRMFDHGDEPWGDNPGFGKPVFVLTHRPRERDTRKDGSEFTFVTEGIHAALDQARTATGDRNVIVMGGGNVIRQYLEAGLLDELAISLVPVLMGGGQRLFEPSTTSPRALSLAEVIVSPAVTHLRLCLPR